MFCVVLMVAGQIGGGVTARAQTSKRVALVIGNSNYDGSAAMALTNPRNDASDVADALERMNFKVIRRFDMNKGEFDRSLADFEQEASTASVALFYYAGHAMHYGDQSYLMPIGTKLEGRQSIDFQMTSVEDDVIRKALRDVPLKIVILDACRDNPVAEQYAVNFAKNRSIGDVRGLAPIAPADGLLVAYATAPDMFAEDGNGRNSPYTGALLRHMSTPGIEIRSVVLLDEVEKAHPDVHELFFQVFDKGQMEDGTGRRIDFRNTLIILTSNVGTETIMKLGNEPDYAENSEALAAALRPALLGVFPPALLGRIVTIPYYPLSASMLVSIVRLHLDRIKARIRETYAADFAYDRSVVDHIVSMCRDPDAGGRMIDNIITNTLLPELSREILKRSLGKEQLKTVRVAVAATAFVYDCG